MIYLAPELQAECANQDVFAWVDSLQGKIYRSLENRKTLRTEINGKGYFVKIHKGVGWREIFKNLFSAKLPVLGASNEWRALNRLRDHNIATMNPVAYGSKGINPATQHSFIITEELPESLSLEDYCADWTTNPPCYTVKLLLLRKSALISKAMHDVGINHRDYYICHLHLENCLAKNFVANERSVLSMIDLHRAQLRDNAPMRWRVKDVGGIYFSALDIGLNARDVLRFIRLYSGKRLKQTLHEDAEFWARVEQRAINLYIEAFAKTPQLPVTFSGGQ